MRVHRAAEPEAEPPAKKAGRPAKTKTNGNGHAPLTTAGNGSIPFAAFGEYVVVKRSDLAELLAVVARWQAVIEGMA